MSAVLEGKPLKLRETSLRREIYEALIAKPDHSFMVDVKTNKKITYREVFEISTNFALKLKGIGFVEGDVAMVCADSNVFDTYAVILGVWLSGITLCPINPNSTVNEIVKFLHITHSKLIYCGEKYFENVKLAIENLDWKISIITTNAKLPFINYHDFVKTTEKFLFQENNKDKDVISIMFTSGTSGEPKGALLRAEAIRYTVHNIPWMKGNVLITTSVFWITNPICLLRTTLNHGTIIIGESNIAEHILQVITEYKPNIMISGVSLLMDISMVNNLEKYNTTSLSKVYFGGSQLLLHNKRMIANKVFGGRNVLYAIYGSTEAGLVTMMDSDVNMNTPRYESIGKCLPGVKVKIVDPESGKMLKQFQNGELCVKSGSVLRRYVQRPLSDDELDAEGWWHMGDIVYYDDEGYIYYVSRLKEIMKFRGYQIAPAELETIILRHSEVLECAVVGKPHDIDGERPAAFIVKLSSSKLTEKEIYDLVSREVIDAKNLRGGVYFINNLPKNASGKLLRKDLLKLLVN